MVYDGVRDVRHNYVTSLECDEAGEDSELEEATRSPASSPVKEKTHIREAVSRLRPEQLGAELRGADSPVYWVAVWSNPEVRNLLSTQELGGSQVDGFLEEKEKFDKEVNKWEESNNDIIVVAKHMCCIMTDMTDFIKGRGKLKTTADIIESAKRIRFQISPFQKYFSKLQIFSSDAGKRLDGLARQIAGRCPESATKSDLLAYLGRITLYCHQLNITSKVKAEVSNVSGELIVSGLDSAMSLIQAAKNLMNAVVLTVKASYVASRMYKQQVGSQYFYCFKISFINTSVMLCINDEMMLTCVSAPPPPRPRVPRPPSWCGRCARRRRSRWCAASIPRSSARGCGAARARS